jgi:hypothetical protein
MEFSKEVKNAVIIAVATITLYVLLKPKKNSLSKPMKATKDEISQKQNARTILDAYLNAVDAKESSTALQKLNSIFAEEYSMKVYKTKSGSYVARTLDGKDVLVAK